MTALALLIPAMLNAQATMGFYFDLWPGEMAAGVCAFEEWDGYLYLHNANLPVTAVEYQLQTPADPTHLLFTIMAVNYPDLYSIHMGDPFNGHSITYWPYLNGYSPGYNLLCKYTCMTFSECWCVGGGTIADYPIIVGPHPQSGFVRGTYYPDNDTFPIIGLTSILCPKTYATEESSWGAIKGQFK
jgi:hypothetical protein